MAETLNKRLEAKLAAESRENARRYWDNKLKKAQAMTAPTDQPKDVMEGAEPREGPIYEALKDQGYAPGTYLCRPCRDCGSIQDLRDKRGWRCKACATARALAASLADRAHLKAQIAQFELAIAEASSTVSRLTARVDELLAANNGYLDRARKAEGELAEARQVIEPFAEAMEDLEDYGCDDAVADYMAVWPTLTIGDLRRAAAFLKGEG
jgi:hypothetical protein